MEMKNWIVAGVVVCSLLDLVSAKSLYLRISLGECIMTSYMYSSSLI